MALFTSIITAPISVSLPIRHLFPLKNNCNRSSSSIFASISPPASPESSKSIKASDTIVTSTSTSSNHIVNSSSRHPESNFDYAHANPNGNLIASIGRSTESSIERIIFDFRFLALLAVGGSLMGSVLCFLNGCVHVFDAYKIYWTSCVKGVHSGQMVLRLVEAIDIYLAGTVMFVFGMGLYGLFISNVSHGDVDHAVKNSSLFGMFALKKTRNVTLLEYHKPMFVFGMGLYGLFISNVSHGDVDHAVKNSSLFGMFVLKERPKWMKISSLDELKTKVGHVIVMILLVKMFERSKMVTITTGLDLLSYSVCIFLSSASLYILHNLHKTD